MPYTAAIADEGRLTEAERVRRLDPPTGEVEIVLDTDTANEVDDQFALAYALFAETIDLQAVYAAPFDNANSSGPADGMAQSHDEIVHLLELAGHARPDRIAYRGAREYLDDGSITSAATTDLIERARGRSSEDPLYVVAIGAPTNVAAAIDQAPDIVDQIVVVWLGGHPYGWHTACEFNLRQDRRASRVLFDSGVPLVHVPCKNVAEQLQTTVAELDAYLSGNGPLSEYLLEIVTDLEPDRGVWSKVIWDLAPLAYLIDHEWIPTNLVHSPRLSDDLRYTHDTSRHLIRVGMDARRDRILEDVFRTLEGR
ncbi:nucleoside hydrolase [Saliphagus sp. LR7]|uniref:nucleoside hydrolase n=1 Tax=Saliphagus sp. LR7 TaxID=2282654 RepID=UPI000DF7D491|nr:nucleoside hydrolase [Saliphagus sp. LR7]